MPGLADGTAGRQSGQLVPIVIGVEQVSPRVRPDDSGRCGFRQCEEPLLAVTQRPGGLLNARQCVNAGDEFFVPERAGDVFIRTEIQSRDLAE